MAVDSFHSDYKSWAPDWTIMRDVIGGQRRMQRQGSDYLRRPKGLADNTEWQRYVNATPFFEATQRTVEGLTGLAFYREPELTMPGQLDPFLEDCTQDGVPFRTFIETGFEELLSMARVGFLLDLPKLDPTIRSVRDAERAGRRPFLRRYETEDIIYWATGEVKGVVKLTQARLREIETEDGPDEFTVRWRRRIRVLELVKVDNVWRYRQRLFVHRDWHNEAGDVIDPVKESAADGQPIEETNAWTVSEVIEFKVNGQSIDYIPFWIANPIDQAIVLKRPPLLGLANTNVAHFNTSGMLENALFWVGNPQPYVTGVDPDTQSELVWGSSSAWLIKNPQAKAELLSLDSDKVGALEKRLDRLEQHMAVLGAKMLASEKKQVEAAETARIHRQGEMSALSRVAGSLSRIYSDIALTVRDWMAATGETGVKLNTLFFDQEISMADLVSAVGLWQKNVISIHDLISLGKRAEIIAPERTPESIVSENQSSPIQPIIDQLTDSSGGTVPGGPRPKLKPKPTPAPTA